jgi:hypothetical protein
MQVQSTIGEGTLVQAWIPMLPDVPVEAETTAPAPEQGIPAPQTEGT